MPNTIQKIKIDWLLSLSLLVILCSYSYWLCMTDQTPTHSIQQFSSSVYQLMNQMWWGLLLGWLAVGIINIIPQKALHAILGNDKGLQGIVRATIAGFLFDLCSHGILLIGMKFYKKGLSLGQVMAFLIASPWNSFSLTFILFSLIGFKWTLGFIGFSMLIAIITGTIFHYLVKYNWLPKNPNQDKQIDFKTDKKPRSIFKLIFIDSLAESRMIFRWIFFGVVLAGLVRAFVPIETFQTYFGPTFLGLLATVGVATILEVCSEGSVPIAADLLKIAKAPGNSFAFLMSGVATDYTEIMSIKETTGKFFIALLLPLISVPQVLFIAWLINKLSQ